MKCFILNDCIVRGKGHSVVCGRKSFLIVLNDDSFSLAAGMLQLMSQCERSRCC